MRRRQSVVLKIAMDRMVRITEAWAKPLTTANCRSNSPGGYHHAGIEIATIVRMHEFCDSASCRRRMRLGVVDLVGQAVLTHLPDIAELIAVRQKFG